MHRSLLMTIALLSATPAWAGIFTSIEDRAAAVHAAVDGKNSYEAKLAAQYADIAVSENGQHDNAVAARFMLMAEEMVSRTGGKQ